MNRKRIKKLRRTLAAKAGNECSSNLMNTQSEDTLRIDAYAIAADIMGVSKGYVIYAKQIKDPELAPALLDRMEAVLAEFETVS